MAKPKKALILADAWADAWKIKYSQLSSSRQDESRWRMGHTEYRHNLQPEDFDRLAATLRTLKGRFLLTHTDQPEIRALFKGRAFKIQAVELTYTAHIKAKGDKLRQGHEVLVTNY